MSTAVMPQNAMYEFGDIIIKVGARFCVFSADNLLLFRTSNNGNRLRERIDRPCDVAKPSIAPQISIWKRVEIEI